MNPLIKSILTSLVRNALGAAVAWMIAHRWLLPEQVDATSLAEFSVAVVAAIGTLGWIVWAKIKDHIEKNTLAARAGTSVAENKADIKRGLKADATVAEHDVPMIGGGAESITVFAAVAASAPKVEVPLPQRLVAAGVLAAITPFIALASNLVESDNLVVANLPDDLKQQRAIRNEKALDFLFGWMFKLGAKDPNDPKEPKD